MTRIFFVNLRHFVTTLLMKIKQTFKFSYISIVYLKYNFQEVLNRNWGIIVFILDRLKSIGVHKFGKMIRCWGRACLN